jgi:site-specific recombinase XerD
VTRADTGTWLDDIKQIPINRHNALRNLSVFWEWALAEGYVATNLPKSFKKPKVDRSTVAVLTPEQVEAMLGILKAPIVPTQSWELLRASAQPRYLG